jgi:hypothetical protein
MGTLCASIELMQARADFGKTAQRQPMADVAT